MSSEEAPTTEPEPQGEPELGEAGKKAIKAERDRATAAERELAALRAQFDAATGRIGELETSATSLTAELTQRELAIARLNVGIDKGLPKPLIERLRGDDLDAITADADVLAQLIPTSASGPRPDFSQGPRTDAKRNPADEFADILRGKRG